MSYLSVVTGLHVEGPMILFHVASNCVMITAKGMLN